MSQELNETIGRPLTALGARGWRTWRVGLRGRYRVLPLVLVFALLVVVYRPGLLGPFLLDDYGNILANPMMWIESLAPGELMDAAYSTGKSYPHRGLARVSFALNYYFSGRVFDPYVFKVTNLAIHALNGLLVYWLSVLLLKRYALASPGAQPSATMRWLPLVVAAVWVLHPIHLTSVLYVVQRMTSMAGTFVFAGLLVFVLGRTRVEDGRGGGFWLMLGGLGGGTILGFLCKQTAVLLPFLAFVVEWFFFRRERLSRPVRSRLWLFYAVVVGVPAAAGLVGLVVGWEQVVQMYSRRDFTPWERLLSESRILFFYLALLLVPYLRWYGLYHDDLAVSRGWLEPWTTLPSVLGWACLLGLAAWGMRRRALWAFALAWYVVGHALESTVLGLELVFEHRNYVPSFGVLLVGCCYLARALRALPNVRRVMWPLLGAILGVLAFTTYTRAHVWDFRYTFIEWGVRNHPESARYNAEFALELAKREAPTEEIYHRWQRVVVLDDREILPLVQMLKLAIIRRMELESASPGEPPPPLATPLPDVLVTPLPDSADELRLLERALDAEIERRARERTVPWSHTQALSALLRCVRHQRPWCVSLMPRAIEWYEVVGANPRSSTMQRAIVYTRLGELSEVLGDLDRALEYRRQAAQIRPDQIQFQFDLFKIHLARGELEPAAASLARAEEMSRANRGVRGQDVAKYRRRLAKELQQRDPGSSPH